MLIQRFPENPLITPGDVPPTRPDFVIMCVFNAGVTRYRDEIILLLRVAEQAESDAQVCRVPVYQCEVEGEGCVEILEFSRSDPTCDFHDPRVVVKENQIFLTSISHLRVARSKDGRKFTVDPEPALCADRPSEMFGLEDPRITEIDGTYYIAYKSVSPTGICTSLAVTRDWEHFEKKGIIFCPENLDVCIFPEKVGGRYVTLSRPVPKFLGAMNMWVSYSPDLVSWGDHHFLMGVQPGSWEAGRIGGGAIPIKTEKGWLEIYHGATANDHYCLGAVLLDLEEPHKIVARGKSPFMEPQEPYETTGLMPNVIFTCGAVVDGDNLSIYYGAADTVMAGVETTVSGILESLEG